MMVLGNILCGLALILTWFSLANTAAANTTPTQTDYCVRPDGMGGCFSTIQAAVNAASNGDTITIAGGTYTESVFITRTLAITGGWQPPGWPYTETVVQANGANCALLLNNVSGSLSNLTATGANTAGICGTDLLTYTMANVTARNNIGHGTAVEVSHTLTISQSTFNYNGQHGLLTSCTYHDYGGDTFVTVNDTIARGNGFDGFNGGFMGSYCDFHLSYINTTSVENVMNGFNGFSSSCPALFTKNGMPMMVDISASVIMTNGIGISGNCGSQITITNSIIQENGIGLLSNEAVIYSLNNLYADNQNNGLEIRAGIFNSTNDTIANNGLGELTLFDDSYPQSATNPLKSGCDTPHVELTNTIIWDVNRGIEWFPYSGCAPYIPGPFTVEVHHSLIAGRELLVDEENIIYFTIGTAVYDANPFFAGNGSYQLLPPSPAIDRGTADNAPPIDINGNPRPQDGDGNTIPEFDMGAYEAPPGLIYHAFMPAIHR